MEGETDGRERLATEPHRRLARSCWARCRRHANEAHRFRTDASTRKMAPVPWTDGCVDGRVCGNAMVPGCPSLWPSTAHPRGTAAEEGRPRCGDVMARPRHTQLAPRERVDRAMGRPE